MINKCDTLSGSSLTIGRNPNYYTELDKENILVETIPAITYCENCQKTYETVKHGKICPHCGSEHTFLTQGNEFNIKEIAGV